jgi:hypothetical protein
MSFQVKKFNLIVYFYYGNLNDFNIIKYFKFGNSITLVINRKKYSYDS